MTYTVPLASPPDRDPAPGWGQSLSAGAAGITLLHAEYARSGSGDWPTVHRWVAAMTRSPVAAHPDASLFHGVPAVAFALRAVGHPGYAAVLRTLEGHIDTLTRRRLDRVFRRIERGQLPFLGEFDLINGLTGIGVYLLQAGMDELLREVLSYLVRLAEPITIDGDALPGWWSGNGPADKPSSVYPGGHGNLGLAHGIAGPLALMAVAMIRGITVPRQAEAIDHIDAGLDRRRCGTRSRPWWPGVITRTEWESGTILQPGPQRPSWCYGTPGIARARQLAALALGDEQRQRRAEAALAACIVDDTQLTQLRDGSLCHGWAGLMHTTGRAAADAGSDSELASLLPQLHARWHRQQLRMLDHDGMLEGATGIALVQQAHDTDREPVWDACLLTAPPTPKQSHLEGIG